LKKISINSIYIILNLIYIIPGIFCAFLYFTSSYDIFYSLYSSIISIIDLSQTLAIIFALIIWKSFWFFYIMSFNFTILIHPIIQIIIYILVWKNKIISKKNIIIVFILSIIIAFIFLYLIWGKGYILTV
jgi:hypothetical protein